jgi:hypothetical protein
MCSGYTLSSPEGNFRRSLLEEVYPFVYETLNRNGLYEFDDSVGTFFSPHDTHQEKLTSLVEDVIVNLRDSLAPQCTSLPRMMSLVIDRSLKVPQEQVLRIAILRGQNPSRVDSLTEKCLKVVQKLLFLGYSSSRREQLQLYLETNRR